MKLLVFLYDSLEQLLNQHKIDPERVLANLGFANHANHEFGRLPRRFLANSSTLHGISIEEYVKCRNEQCNGIEERTSEVRGKPAAEAAPDEGQQLSFEKCDKCEERAHDLWLIIIALF
jgi:hypothetical protein